MHFELDEKEEAKEYKFNLTDEFGFEEKKQDVIEIIEDAKFEEKRAPSSVPKLKFLLYSQIIEKLEIEEIQAFIQAIPPGQLRQELKIMALLKSRLYCPTSRTPLTHPVVFIHPQIDPILYDKKAALEAISTGELVHFGIDDEEKAQSHLLETTVGLTPTLNSLYNHHLSSFFTNRSNNFLDAVNEFQTLRSAQFLNNSIFRDVVRVRMPINPRRFIFFRNAYSIVDLSLSALAALFDSYLTFSIISPNSNLTEAFYLIFNLLIKGMLNYVSLIHLSQRGYKNCLGAPHWLRLALLTPLAGLGILNKLYLSPLSVRWTITDLFKFMAFLFAYRNFIPNIVCNGIIIRDLIGETDSASRPYVASYPKIVKTCFLGMTAFSFYLSMHAILKFEEMNDFLAFNLLAFPLVNLPYSYLSLREAVHDVAKIKTHLFQPTWTAPEPNHDCRPQESTPLFMARMFSQLILALLVGILFSSREDYSAGSILFLAIKAFTMGSLANFIPNVNNRYRLHAQQPRAIVELNEDDEKIMELQPLIP